MSKSNINTKKAIEDMLDDLEKMQGYVTQEIIKYAEKNGGRLPLLPDQKFQHQLNTLLNTDPREEKNKGHAVLSIKATELGIEEQIDSLKKRGVPDREFQEIQTKLKQARKDFSQQLSSNAGIEELVKKRVVSQLLLNKSDFLITDQKTEENRFLTPQEKYNHVKKLQDKIVLPEKILPILLDPAKQQDYKKFQDIIYQRVIKSFAKRMTSKDIIPVLDQNKLTKASNMKKFERLVIKDIKAFSNARASAVVDKPQKETSPIGNARASAVVDKPQKETSPIGNEGIKTPIKSTLFSPPSLSVENDIIAKHINLAKHNESQKISPLHIQSHSKVQDVKELFASSEKVNERQENLIRKEIEQQNVKLDNKDQNGLASTVRYLGAQKENVKTMNVKVETNAKKAQTVTRPLIPPPSLGVENKKIEQQIKFVTNKAPEQIKSLNQHEDIKLKNNIINKAKSIGSRISSLIKGKTEIDSKTPNVNIHKSSKSGWEK